MVVNSPTKEDILIVQGDFIATTGTDRDFKAVYFLGISKLNDSWILIPKAGPAPLDLVLQ